MPKNDVVRARINADLKQQVEGILASLGLNVAEAINLYFTQIALHDGLPFEIKKSVSMSFPAFPTFENESFEAFKARINLAITKAEEDIAAGRVLTAEQSIARMQRKLETLQADQSSL